MEKRTRILMVEEDEDFRKATLPVLEGGGHEVIWASSCEEGLSRLRESVPHLIVIDLIMKGRGDGILFARRLRRNSEFSAYSKIPLLMLSDIKQQAEFSFPSLTRHPFFLPVDEFLEKPLSPESLLQKVEDLLRAKATSP